MEPTIDFNLGVIPDFLFFPIARASTGVLTASDIGVFEDKIDLEEDVLDILGVVTDSGTESSEVLLVSSLDLFILL